MMHKAPFIMLKAESRYTDFSFSITRMGSVSDVRSRIGVSAPTVFDQFRDFFFFFFFFSRSLLTTSQCSSLFLPFDQRHGAQLISTTWEEKKKKMLPDL
ncbi:hypothetical protein POVWA2_040910 [Plasmodium ovale wallikeri]|uniref:Uncharacterized protein n=1 Tax=Plasmodium ovale wallikeri TaxID=864142 RepID=A0A1A8ZAS8_PLAOA|nr:hypothetical protein POVWA2_040910 [Plasmodium ovale wallikeri]